MHGNGYQRRVERLEAAQQGQARESFSPLREADRLAWPSVSDEVKAELRATFERCGPMGSGMPTIIVARRGDGTWRPCTFNTAIGRAEHCIVWSCREQGDDAFLAWLQAHATPEEIAALVRIVEADWDPSALEPGDAVILERLGDRVPK